MKPYILAIFLLLFLGVTNAFAQAKKYASKPPVQSSVSTDTTVYIYRSLGSYVEKLDDGSVIEVSAYITKGRNNTQYYTQYKNVFTLKAKSKSIYKKSYTETWLYNTRVFLGVTEISAGQYPLGFTSYVKTTPTIIYYWYTNDENIGQFYFNWNSSAYEPR